MGYVDLYSGLTEAFAIPDTIAATIAHLIIEELFPRYEAPFEILTENGTENKNRTVKETFDALNISHVKTSYYHPQSNARVKRFYRTLYDVIAKKVRRQFINFGCFPESDSSSYSIQCLGIRRIHSIQSSLHP